MSTLLTIVIIMAVIIFLPEILRGIVLLTMLASIIIIGACKLIAVMVSKVVR